MVEGTVSSNTPTMTEVILALPGDTVEKHTQTLNDVVDAGFDNVRMYQLILLPQTEMSLPDTRKVHAFQTRFRINPRSFGKYEVLGKEICPVEYEEIVVANATLSFKDYLDCRELNLTIEVFHNTGLFEELRGLVRWMGLSWFHLIKSVFDQRHQIDDTISDFYIKFSRVSQDHLWESREDLKRHVTENIEAYLVDPVGTNEMSAFKATAFFELFDELHAFMFGRIREVVRRDRSADEILDLYIDELEVFSRLRKKNVLRFDTSQRHLFHFDFPEAQRRRFEINPSEFYRPDATLYSFQHSQAQKKRIQGYTQQYGTAPDGLGRILMRAAIQSCFREVALAGDGTPGLALAS